MSAVIAPRRRKSERRAEILAAAREVFLEHAFDQASVSQIAARARCVEGTLYTYFRNKRDLFDSVLIDFYDRLVAEITPRFAAIEGTRDRLSYLVSRHLQIAIEEPGMGGLIRESRRSDSYFGSTLHTLNRRYSQFVLRTLREGIERGELRADLDVGVARDMLFGGLEHVSFNAVGQGRRIEAARLSREITRQFLDGWQARDGPAPSATGAGPMPPALIERLDRIERRLERIHRRGDKT